MKLESVEYDESVNTDTVNYDKETGLPKDISYLEKGLPDYLRESIEAMKKSWEIVDSGIQDLHWDICWSALSADINAAETEQEISQNQAWYLRRKYLRIESENEE